MAEVGIVTALGIGYAVGRYTRPIPVPQWATFGVVAPTHGAPTYRILSESGTVLTETRSDIEAVKSWRVVKNNPRTEGWRFMQDDAIRESLTRTTY